MTTQEPRRQPRDENGMIEGGSSLVDAFTNAWLENFNHDPGEEDLPLHIDPDLPVWGTINRDEVK